MAKRKSRDVLSIRQPWAEMILTGEKWCENRTWKTDFRGRLYIHASRCDSLPAEDWKFYKFSKADMTTGAIVGHVELADIVRMGEDTSDNWSKVLDHVAEHHNELPTKNKNLMHVQGTVLLDFQESTAAAEADPGEREAAALGIQF